MKPTSAASPDAEARRMLDEALAVGVEAWMAETRERIGLSLEDALRSEDSRPACQGRQASRLSRDRLEARLP